MFVRKIVSVFLTFALLATLISVCGGVFTASAETYSGGEHIGNSLVGKVFSKVHTTTYNSSGNGIFDISDFAPVDISDVNATSGMIEFDFYVADAAALRSAMESAGATFKVSFGTSGGDNRVAEELPAGKFQKNGWNHIVLSVRNFYNGTDAAFSAVARVLVLFDKTVSGANGMTMKIANFCGTKLTKETESSVGNKIGTQFPYAKASGIYMDNSNRSQILNFPVKKLNLATLNLNEYMKSTDGTYRTGLSASNRLYIEFDFYVDDYEAFMREVNSHGVKFDFMLSSSSSTLEANYLKYNITKQVCKSGWNHIVLEFYYAIDNHYDAARPYQSLSFDAASVKSYGIMVWPVNQSSAFAAYTYAMTNVIFTKYAAVNATEGTVISSLTTSNGRLREFTNRQSNNNSYDSTSGLYGVENLGDFDFSEARYIEFDIFLENYAVLDKEIKAQNLGLVLHLNSDGTLRSDRTYLEYSFWNQITRPGWNHIVVPIAEWTKSATAPDMTSISSYRLKFTGVSGTNGVGLWYDSATPGTLLGIFNIQATIIEPDFQGHSILLTDAVGVNFFMNLKGLTTAEKNSSYMTFSITNGTGEPVTGIQCDFADVEAELIDGYNYGFTCYINSAQMAEDITPTFHYAGKTVTGSAYSALDYIDYVSDNSVSFDSEVVELVAALGNYGYYSQAYLDSLSNTAIAASYSTNYSSLYNTYKENLTGYEKVDNFGTSGITASEIKLNLEENISMTAKLTGNSNISMLVKKNGVAYSGDTSKMALTNYCLAGIKNLTVSELDDVFTVTNAGGTYSITFSGLSFAYSALNDGTSAEKNLACALYDYYNAAKAYETLLS